MSVEATYDLKLKVVESLDLSSDLASTPDVTFQTDTNVSGQLTATSTIPATKVWGDTRSLTAGTDTIDLTALTGPLGSTVDFTGLKVQLVKIVGAAANTAVLVVQQGDTNPYLIFNTTGRAIDVGIDGAYMQKWKDSLADVSSTVKTIKVTSSDTDASYEILLVAG